MVFTPILLQVYSSQLLSFVGSVMRTKKTVAKRCVWRSDLISILRSGQWLGEVERRHAVTPEGKILFFENVDFEFDGFFWKIH